jgi:hypothetical protein
MALNFKHDSSETAPASTTQQSAPGSTAAASPAETNIDHRRSSQFMSRYANNSYIESSIWDLRLTFGELDQALGPQVVTQHTAITVPWNQAKLLFHFLRVHLAAYEAEHGKIEIPKRMLRELPPEIPADTDPKVWEAIYKAHQQTVAENPGIVLRSFNDENR